MNTAQRNIIKLSMIVLCLLFPTRLLFSVQLTDVVKRTLDYKVRSSYESIHYNVRQGISAAAYAGKAGKWAYTYKFSNEAKSELLDTTMVFETGEITELFTATAILYLAERGKINLSDRIEKYINSYENISGKITIEQLLYHKSGLRDYWDDIHLIRSVWQRSPTKEYIPLLVPATLGKPIAEAGTKTIYSRTNYLLLAFIIEKVSGLSYSQFLKINFFTPLKMDRTYVGYYDTLTSQMMSGIVDTTFQKWGGDMRDVSSNARFTALYGTGNIVSTPSDIAKWGYMLLNGRVLQKKYVDKLFTFSKDLKANELGPGNRKVEIQSKSYFAVMGTMYGYQSFLIMDSINNISYCGVINETHEDIFYRPSIHILYQNLTDVVSNYQKIPYDLDLRSTSFYIQNSKQTIGRDDVVNGSIEIIDKSENCNSTRVTVKVFCDDPDIKLLKTNFKQRILGQGRFTWYNAISFRVADKAIQKKLVTIRLVVTPDTGTIVHDSFSVSIPIAGYQRSAFFNNDSSSVLKVIENDVSPKVFTLEAWIKPSSMMEIDRNYTIAYYGFKVRFYIKNRSLHAILWHKDSYSSQTYTNPVIQDDVWQHVALQWDGVNTPQILYNGKKQSVTSTFSTLFSGFYDDKLKVFSIGNTPTYVSNPQAFMGYIDNVRFWGRILTEKEINNNMKFTDLGQYNSIIINGTFDKLTSVQQGTSIYPDGLFEECQFGEQFDAVNVGVESEEESQNMSPNLKMRGNTLSISLQETTDVTIEVHTLNGERVFHNTINAVAGEYIFQIPDYLTTGLYALTVYNGNKYDYLVFIKE